MITEPNVEAEKLPLHEFSIEAATRQKLHVGALLDDAALLDDDDAIRLLHCAQAMGDDDDSSTAEILVQSLLYLSTGHG